MVYPAPKPSCAVEPGRNPPEAVAGHHRIDDGHLLHCFGGIYSVVQYVGPNIAVSAIVCTSCPGAACPGAPPAIAGTANAAAGIPVLRHRIILSGTP